jgi:hypothetical protein
VQSNQSLRGRLLFYQALVLRSGVEKTRESEWDDDACKNINRVVETTYVSDLTEVDRDSKVKALQNRFESLNNLVEDANHQVLV